MTSYVLEWKWKEEYFGVVKWKWEEGEIDVLRWKWKEGELDERKSYDLQSSFLSILILNPHLWGWFFTYPWHLPF
jgi:hypothetical protein